MPNIVTNQIKISNSKNFVEKLSDTDTTLYVFLGKPSPWNTENNPPALLDSYENAAYIWDNILGLKKILANDVKNVVKRINWENEEIYDQYDDQDINLFSKRFYVINREFDVYKCISNNGGSLSTVEPAGKNLNIFTTADGYRWKYLYTVSTADQLKFLTKNWMPVQKDTSVSEYATDGSIDELILINGGTDYSAFANITISGDGSGAVINPKNRIGVINGFDYISTGTGYRYANAKINDSTGRFANIRAIVSPVGGHGYDPIQELNAHYVMLSARTEYNEGYGDIPPLVKFRQLGIIRNPKDQQDRIANSLSLSGLYKLELSNVSGTFLMNEFLVGSNSKANAFCITANNAVNVSTLSYIQTIDLTYNFSDFISNETVVGSLSGATGIVSNILLPEAKHDTGEILYVENRTPVTRALDQAELLHLVIEF